MTHDDYYSSENIKARATDKQRDDFRDFNDEIAGRDTGKTSRFISDAERERRGGKTASEKVFQSALEQMLANPAYVAAYSATMNALNDAESTVYDALLESADKLKDTSDALGDAIENGVNAEEIARLQKEHNDAKERHKRMLEHDAELAVIRARMEDKDNPPSEEEMDNLKKRATDIKTDAQNDRNIGNEIEVSKPDNALVPDWPLGSP